MDILVGFRETNKCFTDGLGRIVDGKRADVGQEMLCNKERGTQGQERAPFIDGEVPVGVC